MCPKQGSPRFLSPSDVTSSSVAGSKLPNGTQDRCTSSCRRSNLCSAWASQTVGAAVIRKRSLVCLDLTAPGKRILLSLKYPFSIEKYIFTTSTIIYIWWNSIVSDTIAIGISVNSAWESFWMVLILYVLMYFSSTFLLKWITCAAWEVFGKRSSMDFFDVKSQWISRFQYCSADDPARQSGAMVCQKMLSPAIFYLFNVSCFYWRRNIDHIWCACHINIVRSHVRILRLAC